MNFNKVYKISFLTCALVNYGYLVSSDDEKNVPYSSSNDEIQVQCPENNAVEQDGLEIDKRLAEVDIIIDEHSAQDQVTVSELITVQENSIQPAPETVAVAVETQMHEEQIRDGFFGLLTFIELIHDADKVAQKVDRFLHECNATPMTKIRDFAGIDSPRISLLRFATHAARLDGQEGKFALLEELLKRGGNPFIVEEGENFSLAQENALCIVQLCHCNHTGYLAIYGYETASEKVKAKARKRHGVLCRNAKRIQELFEEYSEIGCC